MEIFRANQKLPKDMQYECVGRVNKTLTHNYNEIEQESTTIAYCEKKNSTVRMC